MKRGLYVRNLEPYCHDRIRSGGRGGEPYTGIVVLRGDGRSAAQSPPVYHTLTSRQRVSPMNRTRICYIYTHPIRLD